MEKKKYTTPELKSQKVQLGVFGDYGQAPNTIDTRDPFSRVTGRTTDNRYSME